MTSLFGVASVGGYFAEAQAVLPLAVVRRHSPVLQVSSSPTDDGGCDIGMAIALPLVIGAMMSDSAPSPSSDSSWSSDSSYSGGVGSWE